MADELDQCHTCNFIARFCRTTKLQVWPGTSRNFSTVVQLLFRLEQRFSVQLCRENVVNADWSILVYATKFQCATRHVTLAILGLRVGMVRVRVTLRVLD